MLEDTLMKWRNIKIENKNCNNCRFKNVDKKKDPCKAGIMGMLYGHEICQFWKRDSIFKYWLHTIFKKVN